MYRSGSTWAFNATRLLMEQMHGEIHAVWFADFSPPNGIDRFVVKVHQPNEMPFVPDRIITTFRPLEACVQSLVRMGWAADTPEGRAEAMERQRATFETWTPMSSLEIDYNEITGAPVTALERIDALIGGDGSADLDAIAAVLQEMKAPASGEFDPVTLLHPGHRAEDGN